MSKNVTTTTVGPAAPAPKQPKPAAVPALSPAAGSVAAPDPLWAPLQLRLGNRALGALLQRAGSGPADTLEREADRFADQAEHGAAPAHRVPAASPLTLPGAMLQQLLGEPGRALPRPLRRRFESRLGVDLRAVQLHSGVGARRLATQLGARAFTFGSEIVLGAAAPPTTSAPGRWLLAHELAHVAQQARGRRAGASPLNDALAELAHLLDPSGRAAIQRQPTPDPLPADAGAAAAVVPDDEAFEAGIDAAEASAKNLEWWDVLGLGEALPLRHLDPEHHPHAYANRVRRAQQLMRTSGLPRVEGARLGADGVLGPRTFLALLAVARDPAHTARAAVQGLGFDLDTIAAATDAELIARAHARVAETRLRTTVEVFGEAAVRYYDVFYSMVATDREVFDRTLFGDSVPAGLRREDRIEMLHRLYGRGDRRLQGTLEVVQVQRDFIHTRIDTARAVQHDRRRGIDRSTWFSFVATSPVRFQSMLLELDIRAPIDRAMARQAPDERLALSSTLAMLLGQSEGPVAGAPEMAAVLLALYLPQVADEERRAVADAVLAERAARERLEREHVERNNREAAHQRADLLVSLIHDEDTNHLIVESRIRTELERAVQEREFFDLLLDDLAQRPGGEFDRLFDRVRDISGDYVIGLLVRAAMAGRYRDNARVRAAQAELIRRHGRLREHSYVVDPGGDALRGAVLVEGDDRVEVGQVAGDVTSAYLRDEDREQLKPDAQRRLTAALEEQSRAYMARLLEGNEPARTQDEIGQLLMQQAWAAAALDTDHDVEDVEWQESIRVRGVRRAPDRGDGVPRYEVDYERVQRIVGGEAGDTPWTAVEGSRSWHGESEFEYDMFWYAYSQSADVMITMAKVVAFGGVIVIAWEVGVIAALVSAGGGAIPVGLSIGISLAIYMLTHERWTLSGLLLAGIEGYLGAVGFRVFAPVGAAVGRLVIPVTLEQVAFRRVVAAWLLRHGTVGALTGGTLGPASLFMQDLVRVAGSGGGFSSFAAYLRAAGTGMLMGAMFEIGGSALLSPLFRNADSAVLSRVDEVVMTLNGTQPRLTPSQWMAHVGRSLSATREYLAVIMAEANARGVFTILRERAEQVGSAFLAGTRSAPGRALAGARATLHREVIEMAGARISREALDGLERLLRLGSTRLGDDALATLLQQARRTPERIDPWLRFFSGLDETATADLVARGQLRGLLDAEQALALAVRRTPGEVNTLLGARFAHVVADLDGFATRLNRLEVGAADTLLEALRARGTAVTPHSLLRVAEAGHALDDELFGGLQRMLDGADAARLDAVMDQLANDQVAGFLRQAHTAAPAELRALRDVVANFGPGEVAWAVRLPAVEANTLLSGLSLPARAVIVDVSAVEAQALVATLGQTRVNGALGLGAAGTMRGTHLRTLQQRLPLRTVEDMLDSAGTNAGRLGRVTRIAANIDAAAARLPGEAIHAGTQVLDSNARSAVEDLLRGANKHGTPVNRFADLDANYREAINAARAARGLGAYVDPPAGTRPTLDHIVGPNADLRAAPLAGAEAVAGEQLAGRASQVLANMRGIRPDRAHPDYPRVIDEMRIAPEIGGPKGAVDRSLIADTLFAETSAGVRPSLVTVDQDICIRLARRFAGAPRTFTPGGGDNWLQLAARYPEGRFTIDILGHRMDVIFQAPTGRAPVPP